LKTENKCRKLDEAEVIDKDGEKRIRRELEKTKMFVNNKQDNYAISFMGSK